MKYLLLVVPLLAIVGCDFKDQTTQGRKNVISITRAETTVAAPTSGSSSASSQSLEAPTDPPRKTDPKNSLPRPPELEEPKQDPPEEAPPIPDSFKLLNKDKKNLYFEIAKDGTRRVHLLCEVCLREGPLEVFVCKMNSKEHESILHIDVDGREIHAALILANAKPGHPVKFAPRFEAASGTPINITLTYREKGKIKTCPAGEWIKDKKTGKDFAYGWVFAGSRFLKDPDRPEAPPYYTANQGEFICLSNFADAMLDLPVKSSKDAAELIFEVNTPRIPPLGTQVIVTLEPVVEKKK